MSEPDWVPRPGEIIYFRGRAHRVTCARRDGEVLHLELEGRVENVTTTFVRPPEDEGDEALERRALLRSGSRPL